MLARAPASERMSATLAAMIGGLAMLIAAIGAHATLAYMVSRRRREIGVRVAIGAAPGSMARMVMREGLVLTLAGVAIGLPLAFVTVRTLRTLMFGVSATDPATFAAVTVLFLLLGPAAGIIPARRAAAVDPAIALRSD
jgi:putative ABC transport system permease protein